LEGKKHFLYQSKVKSISSNVAGEFIKVEIVPNPPPALQKWGI